MSASEWRIDVADEQTRAVYEPATAGDDIAVFVAAHGAGGSMTDRSMLAAANALRARGFGVVRFNFLYKERGSSRTDPMPKCMSVIEAVVARTRKELSPRKTIIGGRSFGGRAASMLAADGYDANGLLLLAYPLHPPGQPNKLRDEHLPKIRMPVICFNGTRDPFCTPEIMKRVLKTVTAPWEMHWLEGADHSFHVLKSSGRTDADVVGEMADASASWLAGLSASQS
jgi:predicted alpha/beta-hydrolase family hydrolase